MLTTAVVRRRDAVYPAAPFSPPLVYPELRRLGQTQTDPENRIYGMVRRCFERMGLDRANAGSPEWNPLGDLIGPESRVVVKPNFVQHDPHAGSLDHLVTHPSVVRPILDYVLLAQGSFLHLDVIDSPEIHCRFELVLERLGWGVLRDHYDSLGHELRVTDIRTERAEYRDGGAIVDRIELPGDPRGFVCVDLGCKSELAPIAGSGRFYGADYDRKWTNKNHTATVNRYVVSRTFLEADLVISIPKLKTHKKAGITCAMKNLVGINGDKNLLPHYTIGDALVGGCEYSTVPASRIHGFSRRVDRAYRDWLLARRSSLAGKVYNRLEALRDRHFPLNDGEGQIKGDWWGNDVVWRTILDLNKVLAYASPEGGLSNRPARRRLAVVDAILAGEGEGPHLALPRPLASVIGGEDFLSVDAVAAQLMGFDPELIPQLTGATRVRDLPLVASSSTRTVIDDEGAPSAATPFAAPSGWKGRIERHDARPA